MLTLKPTSAPAGRTATPPAGHTATPPAERTFRPDVQGLRALAILLVVAFHAGVPLHGGYVGVDVFFVISGFVITGVLLRERDSTRSTSIVAFYARRVRRILPAASLVIVVVVLAANGLLGGVMAQATAADARWATAFLANFHFAASGTNYLASQRPPSPLQNFWSLAVEEQFYLVYPALFAAVAWMSRRASFRRRLGMVLSLVIVASFIYSVVATSGDATSAYFSPFARAWELALGALVALATTRLRRMPASLAGTVSWIGFGAVIVAALAFGAGTAYPGAAVALPVVGTAAVIAAGAARPSWGAESILRLGPVQGLAAVSYSLYLWHWPVLTIAAERSSATSLGALQSALLVGVSLVLAVATYRLVENPIRNSRALKIRRGVTIAAGFTVLVASFGLSTVLVSPASSAPSQIASAGLRNVCPVPSPKLVASLRARHGLEPVSPGRHEEPALVIGDSTACTMMAGLQAVSSSYGLEIGDAAVIACGVVSGEIAPRILDSVNRNAFTKKCASEAQSVEVDALLRQHPKVVLWSSIWERNPIVGPGGRVLTVGSPAWKSTLLQRINKRVFEFASAGARTVFVLQPPAVGGARRTLADARDESFLAMNAVLRAYASTHPQTTQVVDLGTLICAAGPPCPYYVDGVAVRPDGYHYSADSALFVARWLLPQVLAPAGSPKPGVPS